MFSLSLKQVQRAMLMASLAGSTVLAGCSANFGSVSATAAPIATTGGSSVALGGSVHGGQQPVNNAKVQLWVAGTSGYGSTATALGSPVTTNSNGGFTLGSYSCPTGSYAYITAAGGDPQISAPTNPLANNTSIALMTALGPCSALSSSTFIQINEVTTVAAVWALAPFMSVTQGTALASSSSASPSATVGTSSTNVQGLANAMAVANVLASSLTGSSPGANTSANTQQVEYWQVNTLANILALCINSTGTGATTCSPVASTTTPSGGTAPADTLQMALYLAQNPTKGTALFSNISGTPPFQPYDSSVNDWTIGMSFVTGTSAPRFVAADQFGNIWSVGNSAVAELDPTGNVISSFPNYTLNGTTKSFGSVYQVALDTANNAWVTDQSGNLLYEYTGSTSAGGANGGITQAIPTLGTALEGIAIDGLNNVWYANSSGKLYEVPVGTTTPVAGLTTTSLPYGVAIDMSNNPNSPNYTVSNHGSFVYEVNYNGCSGEALGGGTTAYGGSIGMAYGLPASGGTPAAGSATPVSYLANAICNTTSKIATNGSNNFMSLPAGIAVDNGNNLWIVNQNYVTSDTSGAHYSLTKATQNYGTTFTAASINTELSFANYSGGGLSTPWYIAMDGASSAWVSNSLSATTATGTATSYSQGLISEFSNAGVPVGSGLYGGTYAVTSGGVTTTYRRAIIGARGIAVDPSGNVWIANSSTFTFPGTSSAAAFVTMMVGAAQPTVTPLSRGIANDTLASRP